MTTVKEISAKQVAELRAKTGAGMMDCKKALEEAGGDMNSETDFVARTDDFKALAKEIAVHIAATKPLTVRVEDLSADVVQRERQVYEAQVAEQKKPEAIRGKIVDGMMKKFYEDNVLLEQKFVKDDKRTVGEMVQELSGKTGEKIQVRRFMRFELGGN